jgi:hypothetical protein
VIWRILAVALVLCAQGTAAQQASTVGIGWAKSSVNAVIFRTNSVVTYGRSQYTAYYDDSARVVLAKRTIGSDGWTVKTTSYTNDVTDAHNAIAIAVDGRGVLHVAWAEHNKPLHYSRGVAPGSLELGAVQSMTGQHEERVTYPQFYALPGGDLLFVYRDGRSGSGDTMLNRFVVERGEWHPVAHPLITGEGARNAYVNSMAIDKSGGWHVSWVWRESPDVASNHDIMYAFSPDEGRTWRRSDRSAYALPITASSAEIAWPVPQSHELINQTSMTVDAAGHPIIATYWRADGSEVPQFQLVWHDGSRWRASQINARTQPFRLSGGGTKRIPVSRPLVIAGEGGAVHVVFRDEERGSGIWVATSTDRAHAVWRMRSVWHSPVGQWEPTFDAVAWRRDQILYLFVQRVGQGDGESLEDVPPQPVSIIQWSP